jgi:hypothetical protein
MKLELKAKPGLIIGGEPRANLLPVEVRAEFREGNLRRILTFVLVGVVVVVGAGVGGSLLLANSASSALESERSTTASLLAQQVKYIEVRQITKSINQLDAASEVATTFEVDWKAFMDSVSAVLPGGVAISSFMVDSATPLTPYPQATVPLQKTRVATLSVTVSASVIPNAQALMDSLASVKGVADVSLTAINEGSDNTGYAVTVVVHVNQDALSARSTAATEATK